MVDNPDISLNEVAERIAENVIAFEKELRKSILENNKNELNNKQTDMKKL